MEKLQIKDPNKQRKVKEHKTENKPSLMDTRCIILGLDEKGNEFIQYSPKWLENVYELKGFCQEATKLAISNVDRFVSANTKKQEPTKPTKQVPNTESSEEPKKEDITSEVKKELEQQLENKS